MECFARPFWLPPVDLQRIDPFLCRSDGLFRVVVIRCSSVRFGCRFQNQGSGRAVIHFLQRIAKENFCLLLRGVLLICQSAEIQSTTRSFSRESLEGELGRINSDVYYILLRFQEARMKRGKMDWESGFSNNLQTRSGPEVTCIGVSPPSYEQSDDNFCVGGPGRNSDL